MTQKHYAKTNGRLLAKLAWELMQSGDYQSLPDFTEALKRRCAQLRIPWTNDDINDAYRRITSHTPLPGDRPRGPVVERREVLPDPPSFNKSDAAAVYRQLIARYRAEQPRVVVPGAPEYFPALVRVK